MVLAERSQIGWRKFRRHAPVGPYIVDFICLRRRLIVEADGGQHIESKSDERRDQWLVAEGYEVVRYGNLDILQNPEGLLTDLFDRLERQRVALNESPSPGRVSLRSPRPPSPPEGRGQMRRVRAR